MASIRPSEFNRIPRDDGGPFLYVEEDPAYPWVDVYFSDVPEHELTDDTKVVRLLRVEAEAITLWPLHVRADRDDYLRPKYDSLESIVIAAKKNGFPYELPANQDDVEALLQSLPDGFAKDFRFGLGLLWEYRSICTAIAGIPNIVGLIVHGGSTKIEQNFYFLNDTEFKLLRREIKLISGRNSRRATLEKRDAVYHQLLHAIDPERYPPITRQFKEGALTDAVRGRRGPVALNANDQHAAITLVADNIGSLVKNEPNRVMALKAEIEAVTLQRLIAEYDDLLTKKLPESRWQRFFQDNPFVLSLAFATPYLCVQGQAYAGGTRINGSGAKYGDFLLAAVSTGNLALVEIKRSDTPLLGGPLRNDVYPFSTQTMGAIAQVLDQRRLLMQNISALKNNSDRSDIHDFAVRCVVIAGTMPVAKHERKSLEMLRQSLLDVVLITYDEMAIRLKEIAAALRGERDAKMMLPSKCNHAGCCKDA